VVDGFSYALQIWLMEAVPDIGSLLGQKLREGGDVFPSISTSGNFKDVITDAEFVRACEMKDERVDLIIDMQRNKYDWSKHVWAYKETVKPFQYSSEEDGSDEEAAVETSETEIEEEIESIRVSPTKKRKNRFRDTGAESRKKRLLCQRSTEKYRDLEEEMKSYIQSMFNSSFTALGLECGFCSLSQSSFCDCSQWWSCECCEDKVSDKGKQEDADLSDVFGSLFSTLDVNIGTQEYLQKTMGNLTQDSNVDGFDPSQDKQSEGPSDFTTPMTSFRPQIFKASSFSSQFSSPSCCSRN
ncbi:unnamed protein product, partial [Brassica napus]